MGEHEKTARWYYYSAMAHMGLGNNVAALEHAGKAVALEPQNMEYQMLLQRLQSGGQWYESRQAAYGYPNASGNDLCLKICLANVFCNLCCGGGGLCFGGYGGRGMFSGFPHYNKYTRCRCEMNRETQNLVTCYDLRRQSYRELASDAAFLSAYAGIRISMGMI